MTFTARAILLDSRSMTTIVLQLLIVLAVFGGGFLLLRWLLTRARASRHAAWERDGLLDPQDGTNDPDMNPDWLREKDAREREISLDPGNGLRQSDMSKEWLEAKAAHERAERTRREGHASE